MECTQGLLLPKITAGYVDCLVNFRSVQRLLNHQFSTGANKLRIDCDGDTLLLLVDQHGPACHTRRASCFYHAVRGEQVVVISEPQPIDESRFNHP